MKPEVLSMHVPAKINLFFDVICRRPTGYHEVESLVTKVSLYDSLMVRSRPGFKMFSDSAAKTSPVVADDSLRLMVHVPGRPVFQRMFRAGSIPTGEQNLVMRAARMLQQEAVGRNIIPPGTDVVLIKRIPSQAGLGGGSSDAAAAFILLNQLWKLELPEETLADMGGRLGCDVPLFLRQSPVICRELGEKVDEVPFASQLPCLDIVILYPPVGLSTPAVYGACTPCAGTGMAEEARAAAAEKILRMLAAWRQKDLLTLAGLLFNRLQQAAAGLSPLISRTAAGFAALPDPCVGFSMTGSGSAFFGICRDRDHAARVGAMLKQQQLGEVFVVRTVN